MSLNTDAMIRQLRSRAQDHWEYLSTGERETRTKYALIDPILRSLGWNTEDPTQVKLEYGVNPDGEYARRVDYALFLGKESSKPYILIEAKGLMTENAENARRLHGKLRELETDRAKKWELFSGGGGLATFDDNRLTAKYEDGGMFPGMRKEYLAQLSGYTRAFYMERGYGVVTNGDAWVIYDMSLPGGIKQEPIASISLLNVEDSIHACVSALNILRRASK